MSEHSINYELRVKIPTPMRSKINRGMRQVNRLTYNMIPNSARESLFIKDPYVHELEPQRWSPIQCTIFEDHIDWYCEGYVTGKNAGYTFTQLKDAQEILDLITERLTSIIKELSYQGDCCHQVIVLKEVKEARNTISNIIEHMKLSAHCLITPNLI